MSIVQRLIALAVLTGIVIAVIRRLSKKDGISGLPDDNMIRDILQLQVAFYSRLDTSRKAAFEQRVKHFLQQVRITGIRTTVEALDQVLVAASAIIPVFAFDRWEYRNIHEVLLYPGSFSESFGQEGEDRNIAGMVGNGPMQQVMVLSKTDLRAGFAPAADGMNTGIHEFVHLIDKTDGATDGNPEALWQHAYSLPWLKQVHREIALIKTGHSDIQPYGATNEAEFLAVAAEYFFEQPERMQHKHPELYALLRQAFEPPTGR